MGVVGFFVVFQLHIRELLAPNGSFLLLGFHFVPGIHIVMIHLGKGVRAVDEGRIFIPDHRIIWRIQCAWILGAVNKANDRAPFKIPEAVSFIKNGWTILLGKKTVALTFL